MRIAVVGSGLYGLYASKVLKTLGHSVDMYSKSYDYLIKSEDLDNSIASLCNQARVHGGYHYPRSLFTARQSISHRDMFLSEFKDSVIDDFEQVYGIPNQMSMTSTSHFEKFCNGLGVKIEETRHGIIDHGRVGKTYRADECAIDTQMMMKHAFDVWSLSIDNAFITHEDFSIKRQYRQKSVYYSIVNNTQHLDYDVIVNCTYSGLKDIERLADVKTSLSVKNESCQIILLEDPKMVLENRGYTFMDGPFYSLMPFDKNGHYSLTSVTYTPQHRKRVRQSDMQDLSNLFLTEAKLFLDPRVIDELVFSNEIINVVKTIPAHSDINDSREVVVGKDETHTFFSILGGKLTAIYELDKILGELL